MCVANGLGFGNDLCVINETSAVIFSRGMPSRRQTKCLVFITHGVNLTNAPNMKHNGGGWIN